MGTVLQFTENLTDRQAADAVQGRLDWKYCLALALEDEGFDFSVLSEFRSRLVAGASVTGSVMEAGSMTDRNLTMGLTDYDRQLIAEAREVAGLDGGAVRAHRGG